MTALNAYDPPTAHATIPHRGRLAAGGYVAYASRRVPYNRSPSHPGFGATPTEAIQASCYWANQIHAVRVVPATRAPRWVLDSLERRRALDAGDPVVAGGAS